jgi:hypothetical protein
MASLKWSGIMMRQIFRLLAERARITVTIILSARLQYVLAAGFPSCGSSAKDD